MRAVEGLAIRLKDIDFSVTPTKVHIYFLERALLSSQP
jgi:hypothetical protein